MTKKMSAKRALISSLLVMAMCFSMLVGSTFAWFTDSVTSAGNIIKSGTLDIAFQWADGTADPAAANWKDASTGAIFDYALWEPGYVQVRHIKISNEGSLALKYKVRISANGTVDALADVIDVYYIDPAVQVADRADLADVTPIGSLTQALAGMDNTATGALAPKGKEDNTLKNSSETITIALKMRESAGNEYQNMQIGTNFTIQLVATQYTFEEDSFNELYDEGATLDFAPVVSPAAFTDALSQGLSASLENDVALGEVYQVATNQNVVINGNGNTLSSDTGTRVINLDTAEGASVTLNDVVVDAADKERAISVYNSPNAEIDINSSTLDADYYTVNVASNAPGTTLNVENTTITGWCAFQTWSSNVEINVDNSTLIGLNNKPYNAAGWNNFSTIVINEPAQGSVITIRNSRIEANATTGNKQTFVSFRAASGATVIFENCTFWKDGVEITDLQEIVSNINFTSWDAVNNSHLTINGVTVLG